MSEYKDLPFDEAIEFFKQKINLPTEKWTDLWEGMHSRAFVVAGAMKSELLADLRGAIDEAIKEGTSIQEFRKNFPAIAKKHGWKYKGTPGWRSSVIFNTNLTTAYQAGRWKQATDPDIVRTFPYWRYRTMGDERVRPEHAMWDNTVLRYDDPWWDTHYPPNGWGCRCEVEEISGRQLEKLKKKEAVSTRAPKDEMIEWTDKSTGEVLKVPKGIDPGWAYNPGKTAWGQKISEETMNIWKAQGAKAWERLIPENWENYGRPQKIPFDKTDIVPGKVLSTSSEIAAAIKKLIGGEEKIFFYPEGDYTYSMLVNAKSLSKHIDTNRSSFLSYLPEILKDPYEIWLSFEKHKATGKVVLRTRLIKGIKVKGEKALLVVFQSRNGFLESWTMIPSSDMKYINRQRFGRLIWKR